MDSFLILIFTPVVFGFMGTLLACLSMMLLVTGATRELTNAFFAVRGRTLAATLAALASAACFFTAFHGLWWW